MIDIEITNAILTQFKRSPNHNHPVATIYTNNGGKAIVTIDTYKKRVWDYVYIVEYKTKTSSIKVKYSNFRILISIAPDINQFQSDNGGIDWSKTDY